MNIAEAIAGFTKTLEDRNKAKDTVKSYGSDVKRVFNHISSKYYPGRNFDSVNMHEITGSQVKEVEREMLHSNKFSSATLIRTRQSWNEFCAWCNATVLNFITKLKPGTEYRDEPISNIQVAKMLEYTDKQINNAKTTSKKIQWAKINILLHIGCGLGLRSCEYEYLTFPEVERSGTVRIINSKHNANRTIPLTQEAIFAISTLKEILIASNKMPKCGSIFVNSRGQKHDTSTYRRWIKKVAKECKIPLHLAKTHGLRHRFAINFNKYKKNDIMLADIMGHKSVETTRNYARESRAAQKRALEGGYAKVINYLVKHSHPRRLAKE